MSALSPLLDEMEVYPLLEEDKWVLHKSFEEVTLSDSVFKKLKSRIDQLRSVKHRRLTEMHANMEKIHHLWHRIQIDASHQDQFQSLLRKIDGSLAATETNMSHVGSARCFFDELS